MKLWCLLILFVSAGVVCSVDEFDDSTDDVNGDGAQIDDMDVADMNMREEADEPSADDEVEQPKPKPRSERPKFVVPKVKGNAYFYDAFVSGELSPKWIRSTAKKDDADEVIAKYDGTWVIEEPIDNPLLGDLGLVLKDKAKHHAIAAKLVKKYSFVDKPFVMQYEVKFQDGHDCGGAYVKLLTDGSDLASFMDKTGYSIMFGPDKCGTESKLHFIFRHVNPITGTIEEKHAKKPTGNLDSYFTDKKTHLYTLIVNPDNSFEILVDQSIVNSGSLLSDFQPPVNPPKEIVDPNDKKPEDWDEREKITDVNAVKPEDWDEEAPKMIVDESAVKPEGWLDDEPELINDPEAEKPSDWDDDMDGDWEPAKVSNPACESAPGCGEWKQPEVKNPAYKGKWKAPMVDNPNYKGKWSPQRIANPNYFEDLSPFKMMSINAIGLELWSMSENILFDNFIITDDRVTAEHWAANTWEIKTREEKSSSGGQSVVDAVLDATNERPWLWALVIVVVLLPIVLFIAYCCFSGSPSQDDLARRKKTDEATADVKESKPDNGSGDNPASSKKKSGRSALDVEVKGDEDQHEADNEEEEEEEEEEDEPNEEAMPTRSSPRKRKPQKD